MNAIPSLSKNRGSMPESFANFTNCKLIIDFKEFEITTPRGDMNAAAGSYSNYKHNLTGKCLIGVAPNGSITFVSEGFPGNTSGKMVTDQCGVLNQLQVGARNSLLQVHIHKHLKGCFQIELLRTYFGWMCASTVLQHAIKDKELYCVAFYIGENTQ